MTPDRIRKRYIGRLKQHLQQIVNSDMRAPCLLALACALTTLPLCALPITYTFQGFGTGSLGGSAFTDVPFTVTVESDTTLITHPFGLPFIFATGPAPTGIDIETIGSASFLSGLSVYVNQRGRELGLTEPGANDLFAIRDPLFSTYDLDSPFGPFTEPVPENFFTFFDVQTTMGPATVSDIRDLTFTAAFGPQPIPEPSTFGLALLASTVALGRRLRSVARRELGPRWHPSRWTLGRRSTACHRA